jgi:uncharacterized protein (DUF488 family)
VSIFFLIFIKGNLNIQLKNTSMEFFTLGAYNTSEEDFFGKLKKHQIDTFCDIRQRRGIRGSRYTFANSQRLQARLKEIGIHYMHIEQLAPTTPIRQMQHHTEHGSHSLPEDYKQAYQKEILDNFNFRAFLTFLNQKDARRVALFCVEENYQTCHRSLVAERLEQMGFVTRNI